MQIVEVLANIYN